jgi:hypothetical protein
VQCGNAARWQGGEGGEGCEGGEGGEGGCNYGLSITSPIITSVNRRQDRRHLAMPQHVVPQQVVVLGARLGEVVLAGERQVAVGVHAGRDAESVGGQLTRKAVLARHSEQHV